MSHHWRWGQGRGEMAYCILRFLNTLIFAPSFIDRSYWFCRLSHYVAYGPVCVRLDRLILNPERASRPQPYKKCPTLPSC